MTTGKSFATGYAPKVTIGPAKKKKNKSNVAEFAKKEMSGKDVQKLLDISDEQLKYQKVWNVSDYRKVSPGEGCVDAFLNALDASETDYADMALIDFGCGTGRAAMKLDEHFDVTPMDFASNCMDENVSKHFGDRFVEHDITKKTALRAQWGFCTDVLEHLPPEQIDDALSSIFESCNNVYFQIATIQDYFGGHPDIKEELHLSVHDYNWWVKKFNEHGCVIHRSIEAPHHVVFMVSGYSGFSYDKLKMNTSEDIVWENMRENFTKGVKQLRPFGEQEGQKVIVLGGGPSLNNHIDEIKEHKANGAKIVTLNNTYGWAKEHDLWPVTEFILDAREFNSRFVDPVDDGNIYIMASQVHPSIIDKLPAEKTWLMQCNLDPGSAEICKEVLGKMYEDWFPVCGGSTIMLRALPALFMMGFRDVEVFGFDSCMMGKPTDGGRVDFNHHHAYAQAENDIPEDSNRVGIVEIAGKSFAVEGWMLSQAKEFIDFRRRLLGGMKIKVHGDGLIAHCLEHNLDDINEVNNQTKVSSKEK